MNGVAGADVARAAARLTDQHLAADLPVIGARPDAAPRILREALVENDAPELAADIGEGKAGGRGDSHPLIRFLTDLPGDLVGLAGRGDLGNAGIAAALGVHARHVVGASDRIVGMDARRRESRRDEGAQKEPKRVAGSHAGMPRCVKCIPNVVSSRVGQGYPAAAAKMPIMRPRAPRPLRLRRGAAA